MNKTLKQIEKFHGHLGPYVVIGYRMGLISNKILGENPFSKNAIVKTGINPPISCIIDGIQVSSLCTLGKNNIRVFESDILEAIFESKTNKIKIKVKEEIINKIISLKLKRDSHEMIQFSEKIRELEESNLFEIEN